MIKLTPVSLSMSLGLLLVNACVLPRADVVKSGDMFLERRQLASKSQETLTASYSYPDLRASVRLETQQTFKQRVGTETLRGQYSYDALGDVQEVVVSPVMFLGGLVGLGRDVATLKVEDETLDKLLHFVAMFPALEHRDNAERPKQLEKTGQTDWKPWSECRQNSSKPLSGKTINVVADDGTVLLQAMTNGNGEAFINVRDAYDELFAEPSKPPRRVVDLTSGRSVALNLSPQDIRKQALEAGDGDLRDD